MAGLGSIRARAARFNLVSLALALAAQGCSCETGVAPAHDAAPSDAGPLFAGIDAPGYGSMDTGPRTPEPCAVPIRRVSFPVGDASLTWTNGLWAFGSHAWVALGGYAGPGSPPPSLHLFDLEAEREIAHEVVFGDEDGEGIEGAFETSEGFDVVVSEGGALHVDHVGLDGRLTGPREPLALPSAPFVRTDDGRYVGVALRESREPPFAAALQVARPSGPREVIELGFETSAGHLTALALIGNVVVGVGYESGAQRVRLFEADLDTASVRLGTLVEGIRLVGFDGIGAMEISASGGSVSVALAYERAEDPLHSAQTAELFWWTLGEEAVTRQVVEPPSELYVGILALGGEMPRQTVIVAQAASLRTWVSAARVRAPGDIAGGSEALGVFTGLSDAAAWTTSEGTAALALLSQHELEVVYMCEGAM